MPAFASVDDVLKYLISVGALGAAGGPRVTVTPKPGNYTIDPSVDPSGTIFTNRGAAGGVTFTLPAPTQLLRGYYYDFLSIVAQIITVATTTADTLITDNDATADSLATAARIGVTLRVVCDGTSWAAVLSSAVPQAAFAQTGTVAT